MLVRMRYPPGCPAGHQFGPPVRGEPRVIIGWSPCLCPGAQTVRNGHTVISCQALRCGWHHHDPPHEGEPWWWAD